MWFRSFIYIIFTVQKWRYAELQQKTAVNLPHVLTQDLELTLVLVTKDILEMEKRVKVQRFSLLRRWPFRNQFLFCLHAIYLILSFLFIIHNSSFIREDKTHISDVHHHVILVGVFPFYFIVQKSRYVELLRTTAVNLLHVLTQDLEPTPVLVTKDILEMEKRVKVQRFSLLRRWPFRNQFLFCLHAIYLILSFLFIIHNSSFIREDKTHISDVHHHVI